MSEGRGGGCAALLLFLTVSGGLAGCFGICFVPSFGCIGLTMIDVATARPAKVKIAGHRWERTIDVEELSREYGEDWCEDVPKDGRIVEEWYERRGKYTKGYRCRYWTLEWDETDSVTKKGTGLNPKPSWPRAPNDKCSNEGCQRPGDKHERYWVSVEGPGGIDQDCSVDDMGRWAAYKPGKSATVDVGGLVGVVYCDTLK